MKKGVCKENSKIKGVHKKNSLFINLSDAMAKQKGPPVYCTQGYQWYQGYCTSEQSLHSVFSMSFASEGRFSSTLNTHNIPERVESIHELNVKYAQPEVGLSYSRLVFPAK